LLFNSVCKLLSEAKPWLAPERRLVCRRNLGQGCSLPLDRSCRGISSFRLTAQGEWPILSPGMRPAVELDLKQRLARLPERDRRAMSAYPLRLKHESGKGRRELSKTMREMDAGRKTPLDA
jgi:hypothetical protein